MIGRADIEGSKSNVAMNAWLPQASSFVLAHRTGRTEPEGSVDQPNIRPPVLPFENMRVDTLSGESSPYLKHYNSTHTLPSVEPVDLLQPTRLRIVLRDRDFYSGYGCYP